jgi:crotonobetainyl-CoA:carnitine CoA-transferase CaiB-like acyl-CoA transferase
MTGALLADLGAEVIKVEQLGEGDPFRGLTNVSLQLGTRDLGFETINRNKRGIAIDLRRPEGTAVIHNLVKESDVFLHNLRPQAAERLGLNYAALTQLNPMLIYSQASGWGLLGPDSNKGAYNDSAAARTGMMYISGEPDLPKPQRTPPTMCDVAGSLCLALATVSALHAREQLGRGQMVDTSIFGATITLLRWPITFALALGSDTLQRPRSAGAPLYNFYKCSDGEWIFLVMAQYDKYWPSFSEALGIKNLEKDPRFENTAAVLNHSAELISILDGIFATKTRAEWMRIFAERDFQ